MPFNHAYVWTLAGTLYSSTERIVTGKRLQRTLDSREQCNIQLIFDYLFFHLLLVIPKLFFALYYQQRAELWLLPVFSLVLALCLWMLKEGVPTRWIGTVAAANTLLVPMLASYFNHQDISPAYALIWILSILFCYITTNLATTLILGSVLCGYLGLVTYTKLHQLPVVIEPLPESSYVATPVLTGLYILFIIRVLGRHYNNILILEQERTLLKQKQHSSLINQHLTKQFMLVKGLSRSGKSEYLEGNMELLEACFTEIEKQCETAIDLLQQEPLSPNGHKA